MPPVEDHAFYAAHNAKTPLDYGFDYNPHGRNARDLELLVDLFGFTPSEVLHAATQLGGEMMGMAGSLGLVREGYLADLILVDGDPIADVRVLQDKAKLLAIMQDGRFHKRPDVRGAAPERAAAAE